MSVLEACNIYYKYTDEEVLKNISIKTVSGEITALIGPNGSGKTTLIKILAGILKAQSGDVLLDNKNILSISHIAKKIAWVAQNNKLAWPFSVKQVVLMGRFPHRGWLSSYKKEDHEITEEALHKTGLWEHRDRLLTTLSGGEVQRAIIARALAQAPEILLLDEPVAHLDLKYKISVLNLIKNLADNGMAVIISLHDLNIAAQYSDRVAILCNGELFREGPPSLILNRENIEKVYETKVSILKQNELPVIFPVLK
jgi:iron complex transport system ATP-binding protein